MRAEEFTGKPHLYLDMDGVQADFFTAWAQWHNRKFGQSHVQRYKDIGSREQREQSISELNQEGPEFIEQFFETLPVLPSFPRLIRWITANQIPFTVLSAPLRNNEAASIQGKRTWLAQHNPQGADNPIFTSDKARLATQGGQPNVLVDDFKKYVQAWRDAGGIGILHRDNNVEETIRQLSGIYGISDNLSERRQPTVMKTYVARLRIQRVGHNNIFDTTIQARNPEQARRLLRQMHGDQSVIVGQPRELK
jgi:hypothetical protein